MSTEDPLLKKARQAEEHAKRVKEEAIQAGQVDHYSFLNKFPKFKKCISFIVSTITWIARKVVASAKWACFERANRDFKRNQHGKLIFSVKRLGIVFVSMFITLVAIHAAASAAYFYGTQFEELVYTTGKQEITTGQLYQFTGCTSLPCSTDKNNGKFYKVESSWYFPHLVYPEEKVYANIPQQDGACYVKGYGLYIKELKAIHRSAQWYQKIFNISCRPYTEEEKALAVTSGNIVKPDNPDSK